MFLGQSLVYSRPAAWAKPVALPQASITLRARELYPTLQVLDGHRTLLKVYVLHLKGQSLGDAAAEPEQKSDQQSVTEATRLFLHVLHIFGFQVNLHPLANLLVTSRNVALIASTRAPHIISGLVSLLVLRGSATSSAPTLLL